MAKKGKSGFIGSDLNSRIKGNPNARRGNSNSNVKGMPGHCGQTKGKPIIGKSGKGK